MNRRKKSGLTVDLGEKQGDTSRYSPGRVALYGHGGNVVGWYTVNRIRRGVFREAFSVDD